jgi:hypothetical protein
VVVVVGGSNPAGGSKFNLNSLTARGVDHGTVTEHSQVLMTAAS